MKIGDSVVCITDTGRTSVTKNVKYVILDCDNPNEYFITIRNDDNNDWVYPKFCFKLLVDIREEKLRSLIGNN